VDHFTFTVDEESIDRRIGNKKGCRGHEYDQSTLQACMEMPKWKSFVYLIYAYKNFKTYFCNSGCHLYIYAYGYIYSHVYVDTYIYIYINTH
jgi:hypothetical protein